MSPPVQTTSDSLSKLARWAHSHGTICNLIPNLQHFTHGPYGTVLPPEPGPHGSSIPVAVWGCAAGHVYHWPLKEQNNNGRGSSASISRESSASSSQSQEKFVEEDPPSKVK